MDLGATNIQVALIAAGASIFGAAVGTAVTLWLGIKKLQREYLLEHQAEALVRRLLDNKRWRLRTFKTIKHHVAGFADDDLRQTLIRAGAVRFTDAEGIEVWGLLERNLELIEREYGTAHH